MPKSDRLARILQSPRLDHLVPRLQPELLLQVIHRRGLEDCGDIVARVTPEQLARVFDLDLWRSAQPGFDEALDADRFGVWLDVLIEGGAEIAATKLMGVDEHLVTAALAQHVRVFDRAAAHRSGFEVGAYLVEPRRTQSWDAIVEWLVHLDAAHQDYFNRLMVGCRRMSNEGFEADGFHLVLRHAEQEIFDLAFEREQRREKQGYVTPAQARAFLQLARDCDRPRTPNPVAIAYFRSLNEMPGLMRPGDDLRARREMEEMAFLANVLVAGCSLQGRAFTPGEAADAVMATCRLGRENADVEQDTIRAFEIGWSLLHRDVCIATARRLLAVLADLRIADRDMLLGVHALRTRLDKAVREGQPWRARPAMDVILMLDAPAWAALLGLIAECPVMHAALAAHALRTVSASEFQFISENAQVAAVREYLEALPAIGQP